MTKNIQLAPSILSANFLNLERDVRLLTESDESPEFLHIDVMDGHFVPNLTIGPAFVKALKGITSVPLDVHLMIDNPEEQLDWYMDAGAGLVTVHIESAKPGVQGKTKGSSATIKELQAEETARVVSCLRRIRKAGVLAGLSLNPKTPTSLLLPFYQELDVVLVMSVHPGFGGQSFIMQSPARIEEVKQAAEKQGADINIEVDGGIDIDTAALAVDAGATILVAGNAIYGQANPVAALQKIRRSLAR